MQFDNKYIKEAIQQTITIFRNEIVRIFTDSGVVTILFVAGLFYPILYSLLYSQETITKIPVAAVDLDGTSESRRFVREMDATREISIVEISNMTEAEQLMGKRKVFGIVMIPADFHKDILQKKQTTVSVYVNMTCFFMYEKIAFAANYVMLGHNRQLQIERCVEAGLSDAEAEQTIEPYPHDEQILFNPGNGFSSFFVPAIMMLIIHQLLFLGIGMLAGTVREENKNHKMFENSIDQKKIYRVIFGKGVAYFLVYLIFSAYITVLVPRMFGLPHLASTWDIYRLLLPYLLAIIFFSQTCSVFIRNRETGMVMFLFFSIILLFLAGFTWPRTNFPLIWKVVSYLFPATFGIQGFIKLNTMGAEIGQIMPEYIALWLQTIFYFITACISFRFINK